MAITNRSLDVSEQRHVFDKSFGAVATGLTMQAVMVPYNCNLEAAKLAVVGVSGSPTYALQIWRFIPGAGATSYNPGSTTLAGTAVGTSGIQSFLLASSSSTLVQLQANDIITVTSGGANSAVAQLAMSFVLRATQDIKTSWGV